MKAILLFSCYLMVATLVTGDGRTITDEKASLEGVWELQNQQMYENGTVSETMENENGYRQVKMYSKGKVMWTRNDPSDSNEWFGYGTYTIKDGMLEERLEYASGPMMKIVDTTQVFRFELIIEKKAYQQIQLDEDGNRSQGESYKRIE
eukprot:CAMPEP_0174726786 /NCGR_PEP_ID=MMETSP1094-20130205/48470_1 /TAXON_ID=156173 /ORGANISM="Chrysochromulina brevifilum, Strain UTEX LB 985" /LENGTH=148 /DNA_ID=CAMNT_0015928409 /DNA_START=667 /DNA_END=1113 /DNA_ORIENTATION=-